MTRIKAFDDWFTEPGAYVLVDGQYGSTGKGLVAGLIAEQVGSRITHVTTNAGPNSGHTAYYCGDKIVTRQVPIASVILYRRVKEYKFQDRLSPVAPITFINAGAIVDDQVLIDESEWIDADRLWVHPFVALIKPEDREADDVTRVQIASTGKGTGPAIMRKVSRLDGSSYSWGTINWDSPWDWRYDTVFVETAQGFSLGLNTARFYPNVTSRECTVAQALSDARIAPQMLKRVCMVVRTYPIRVGNTENSSGGCYPDQTELSWDDIGVKPETTTVTGRVRRVFSWSRTQFREALAANRPDVIMLTHADQMKSKELYALMHMIVEDYEAMLGPLKHFLLSFGPKSEDVVNA